MSRNGVGKEGRGTEVGFGTMRDVEGGRSSAVPAGASLLPSFPPSLPPSLLSSLPSSLAAYRYFQLRMPPGLSITIGISYEEGREGGREGREVKICITSNF